MIKIERQSPHVGARVLEALQSGLAMPKYYLPSASLLRHWIMRFIVLLGLLSIASSVAYVHLGRPNLGIDDAHIFFVYGRNIAAGQGIVYTAGGEAVEGYSSPLWMLLVASSFMLSSQPQMLLLAISLLLLAGALTALWNFIEAEGIANWRSLFLLVWILGSPSFIVWTTLTLMDTALWTAVLIGTVLLSVRASAPRWLALFIGLLVLTRSEGLVWGLVLLGVAVLVRATQRGIAQALRDVRLPLFSYILVNVALLIFRMFYFGYPLPNTYYAKISPDTFYNLQQGVLYLIGFLASTRLAAIGLIVAAASILIYFPRLLLKLRSARPTPLEQTKVVQVALSLVVVVGLLIPVWEGGDHFGLYRFYQPIWPLLVLPLLGLSTIIRLHRNVPMRRVTGVCLALLCIVIPGVSWMNGLYKDWLLQEFLFAQQGKYVGQTLNKIFKDDPPSIGVITAGGIAFTYQGVVNDVLGLNNVEMAHRAGDRHGLKGHAAFNTDVFFEQRPRLFLPLTWDHITVGQWWKQYAWTEDILKGIWHTPRFQSMYQLAIISKGNQRVVTFVERDYAVTLVARGYQVASVDLPPAPDDK